MSGISNASSGDAVGGSATASSSGNVNREGTQVNRSEAEGGNAISGDAAANAEGLLDGVAAANAQTGHAIGGNAVATSDGNVNNGGVQINESAAKGGDAISGDAVANAQALLGGSAVADAESGIARAGDAAAHADGNVNVDGAQVNRADAEGGDATSGPAVANAESQFGGIAAAEAESGFAVGGDAEARVESNVNLDGAQNNVAVVDGGDADSGAAVADAASFSPFAVSVAQADSGNAIGGPAFGEVAENVNLSGLQNNVAVVDGGDADSGDAVAEAATFNPFGVSVANADSGNAVGGFADGEIEENVNLAGRQDNVLDVDGGDADSGDAVAEAATFNPFAVSVANADSGNAVGGFADGEIEENVNLAGRQANIVDVEGGDAFSGDADAAAAASGLVGGFASADAETGNAFGGFAEGEVEENVNVDGFQESISQVAGGTAISGDVASESSSTDAGLAFGSGIGINIAVSAGNLGLLGGKSEGSATAGDATANADDPVVVTFDNDGGVAFAGTIGNVAVGPEADQVNYAESAAGGSGFAVAQTVGNLDVNGLQSNSSGASAYGEEYPVEAFADTSGNYTELGEQYNDSQAHAGEAFDLGI